MPYDLSNRQRAGWPLAHAGDGRQRHRLSTAPAVPARGGRIKPSGGRFVLAPPASAANCKRRKGVRAGGSAVSATTICTAPDLNASSAVQRMSSGRGQLATTKRVGSKRGARPSGFSAPPSHAGRAQRIGPVRRPAASAAKVTAEGPVASCIRPSARSGAAGPRESCGRGLRLRFMFLFCSIFHQSGRGGSPA